MRQPLCVDLFCGLGGWTEGFLAQGWDVVGFDIQAHDYGTGSYPAQLVFQDVLTLHGSQFKDVDMIVASPPCQKYSYMAMPWSKAKALEREWRKNGPDNRLFDACFRIQREACEAAGRHIPMVVENVRGAQKWVGRAAWNYGSFYLWGDVPALMPPTAPRMVCKQGVTHRANGETNFHGHKNGGGSWFNIAHNTTSGKGQNPDGRKIPGFRFDGSGKSFQSEAVKGIPHKPAGHWTNPAENGTKQGGDWFGPGCDMSMSRRFSSKSKSRKRASAEIAKIPFALSSWIAKVYKPKMVAA